ncbi:glycine cleavage system aminomethyltransferase GcvT [Gordonia sp. TBRC 11910]|uniref:Aminomethyltransferase n=1 Tax=Gordonia asplenii TaxID=2725283 RepID=A0A848L066_9ACTN|nr:glycine cleavage system aminomethyltransferase GcvT [Gordonia asplenii]NMO03827.1 glycine cleavage system aminomethyltransferase GcvT [Gordonia asplenii]
MTTQVSPLLGEHNSLGAHFTDFAGWQMPLKYAGDLAEHHAVRAAAGLFDLSHMGEIAIDGPDAAALLDYALVGQLSTIGSGRAKYSLICTADGGVIDDLVVYRLADDRFLVVANAANADHVHAEFVARANDFDVSVTDQSASTALIAVQGPQAQNIVQALVSGPERASLVAELKYYAAAPAVVADIDVLLARTGYTGEDGFELYVPNEHAVPLWQALLTETRTRGGTPAGLACRDTLRLEAGMALYGHELTLHTNPYAAGLGKVVRLDTSFVGRDALAALADQQPTRKLVGLVGSGRRAARAGYPVLDTSGHVIGTVTSGALSPTLGYPIAMAYLDLAHAQPGTHVSVDIRGKAETYTVTPRPFYRRPTTS